MIFDYFPYKKDMNFLSGLTEFKTLPYRIPFFFSCLLREALVIREFYFTT